MYSTILKTNSQTCYVFSVKTYGDINICIQYLEPNKSIQVLFMDKIIFDKSQEENKIDATKVKMIMDRVYSCQTCATRVIPGEYCVLFVNRNEEDVCLTFEIKEKQVTDSNRHKSSYTESPTCACC